MSSMSMNVVFAMIDFVILKGLAAQLVVRLLSTTFVHNYKTLLRIFFCPFYKINLLFPTILIIFLLTYPYLSYIFFFSFQSAINSMLKT